MESTVIEQVMVGRRAPLTPDGEESAIRKAPVDGPVAATAAGLAGDEHAYHGHGGPDKVILHCAAENYDVTTRGMGEELQRVITARLETGSVAPWESRLYRT